MSKEKRVKERAAWRELQIVIRNYRALGCKNIFSESFYDLTIQFKALII